MKKIFILFAILFSTVSFSIAAEVNTDALLEYNKGIDLYKIGQYDLSIECFRTAIKLDPDYIDAYYNLGSVLEYLQQYDAALAVFKQIIVRKPEDYDSVYKAAWLSSQLGQAQKAKTYLGIIPPTCARAKDAQMLAAQLYTVEDKASYTSTKQVTLQSKNTYQNSGIYEDIAAPTGITSDNSGNIYAAEFNTNTIMKITPDNKKIVFVKDTKISGPIGLAYDKSNNLYIANYNKDNVLKVSELGEITVLISNVKKPYCLYIDGNMLFISCQGSNSILRYKLNN